MNLPSIQHARVKKKFAGLNVAAEAEMSRAGHEPREADLLT